MIRDGDYYPDAISLRIEHELETQLGALVDVYTAAVRSGVAEITAWDVEGGEASPGGVDELRAALARPGATTRYAHLVAADGTECTVARYEALGRWEVTATRPDRAGPPTADWLKRLVAVARDTVGAPGFVRARIQRSGPHEAAVRARLSPDHHLGGRGRRALRRSRAVLAVARRRAPRRDPPVHPRPRRARRAQLARGDVH